MNALTTQVRWLGKFGVAAVLVSAFALICFEQTAFAQEKVSLPYVSSDADMVLSTQPYRMVRSDLYRDMKKNGGKAADKFFEKAVDSSFKYTLAESKDVMQVIAAKQLLDYQNVTQEQLDKRMAELYDVYVLRTVEKNVHGFEMVTQDVAETLKYEGKEYFEVKKPLDQVYKYAYIADEKTIVWGANKNSIEMSIDAGEKGPVSAEWYKSWQKYSSKSDSWVATPQMLSGLVSAEQFEKLKKLKFVTGSAELGSTVKIVTGGECAAASEAKDAVTAIEESLKRAGELMKSQEQSIKNNAGEFIFEIGQDLVKTAKVKSKGKMVEFTATIKPDMKSLAKAIERTTGPAERMQAANRIRQVALSFHNYESAYGKFPSPVFVHPESGKKYSWRIAILPFMEENEIYEKYDFNQDWDSPHNLEVTSKMPDVFRSDANDEDSTNTSWFMLTGANGMFGEGVTSFGDVKDGTSNTIMAVEAKRKVHWAKPEDLDVDPERPFPELGGFHEGGFNVALADGSVQFIPEKVAEKRLWEMYTASGGEVIDHQNIELEEDN